MAYHHSDNVHRHKKWEKRVRLTAYTFTALTLIVGVIAGVDYVINALRHSDTVVTTTVTSSVRAANINLLRTKYFQFQASDDWIQATNFTDANKTVFYKKHKTLVTERLIVFRGRKALNQEADMPFTYVLPVNIVAKGTKLQSVGKISEHCGNNWPDTIKNSEGRVVVDGVSIFCNKSSKQYNVVIGILGGDEELQFNTTLNEDKTLTMVYSNLTAYPTAGDIYDIINSFEAL